MHELKIAGAFVAGLRSPDGRPTRPTSGSSPRWSRWPTRSDLTVTAEGVETAGQAERLRAIGCDTGQGWHFGRARPRRPHPRPHPLTRRPDALYITQPNARRQCLRGW